MKIEDLKLTGKSLMKLSELEDWQMQGLIDLAIDLKARKASGEHLKNPYLHGKNICLIFQKSSTRTRCATVVGIQDEGGHAEYLGAGDIHFGKKESVADSASVLGRMFDGIMFRGFEQKTLEGLKEFSGIPVWNGLTDECHPTQVFADFMTAKQHFGRLKGLKLAFLGDGRNNVANSLMMGCAMCGLDFVDVCPKELEPDKDFLEKARKRAAANGCTIEVSNDPIEGVKGANIIYTDVWVSMGEEDLFDQRLALLRPYQVDMQMLKNTGNLESKQVIFLHCLPAYHDNKTEISKETGALEVTDEVFSSEYSKVFDEAENRMHTIKAIMVASLYKS